MILQRLYELAVRENLLADDAFMSQPIPFVIRLGSAGEYLGIQDRRETVEIPSKKKGAPPRIQRNKGKEISAPRPHGSKNQGGFACYFADTLARVLPVNDETKSVSSRASFWEQIGGAAHETADPALKAVQTFGHSFHADESLAARIRADVAAVEPGAGDRCTFAWDADRGRTILEREAVRQWYASLFRSLTAEKQEGGPRGVCQVTGEVGPLPLTHPMKLSGIPGGMAMGVSLVSYDKDAFQSYGLEGTANAGVGYAAADGYSRALTALIGNKLKDSPLTSYRVGGVLFLFWTRDPADLSWMGAMNDPADVENLFAGVGKGVESHAVEDANVFYLLGLSGNAARAIVRDYLEEPLPRTKANLKRWFAELRIADLRREGAGKPTSRFPLWQLVAATAADSDRVQPDMPARLMQAALKGDPLPDSILAACLGRLRAEGSEGFRSPARLALIKLTLLRRNELVTETLDLEESRPAYVCGRLLAVFEQIQYTALGDVNATIVDKYFGNFSAAPAMVLSRLYGGALHHLGKIRGDKPGAYVSLDKLLTSVTSKLKAPPKGQLSTIEQAWFALGYYHQKAKQFEEIAARKAAKLADSDAQ